MDKYYTQNGDRPDLAGLFNFSTSMVGGYVFPKLFPVSVQREKAGSASYALAVSRYKGQEGRANGAEITTVERKTSSLSWTTSRLEGRSIIYMSECKAYADITAVDEDGGEDALTACMDRAEDNCHAKIFTAARKAAATTLTNQSVIKILQQKAKAVMPYGTPVLVMSFNAFLDFVNIPEVRTRLEIGALAKSDIGYEIAQRPEVRQAVSSLLTIGDILIFDNDIVGTDEDDYIAVIGVRMPEPSKVLATIRRKATYGVAMFYLPDDAVEGSPFAVSSFADRDNKRNVYDAEGYYSLNELNTGAVEMLVLDDEYTSPIQQVKVINTAEAPVYTDEVEA